KAMIPTNQFGGRKLVGSLLLRVASCLLDVFDDSFAEHRGGDVAVEGGYFAGREDDAVGAVGYFVGEGEGEKRTIDFDGDVSVLPFVPTVEDGHAPFIKLVTLEPFIMQLARLE